MDLRTITATPELEAEILGLAENHFVDLKSSKVAVASLQKHLVAFANSDGGELYVGVEDEKVQGERILGFSNPEKANELITNLMLQTKPSVEGLDIEFIDFGKRGLVLHITIPKSPQVHYTSSDECYIRINASSNKIKGERVTQLGYSKGGSGYSYENTVLQNSDPDEIISGSVIIDYLSRISSLQSPENFLKKQRLIVNQDNGQHPIVAGVLLFDNEPQATLSTRCAIKVYRLHTTDKDYKREHLSEMPDTIEGPVEKQIHEVINKVEELLKDVSYNVDGKLVKLKYPTETLKEILVNAVLHRDYSISDDIHVKIYDNRIEVQSPGKLPGYVTTQNILKERFSRNGVIVRLLHKLPDPVNHDIGEGLNTAYNAMKKAGLVYPKIEEGENAVIVTIEHKRIASLEDIILEYLSENETINNKIVRNLSGEESENKVKKAFQNLRSKDLIEVVDTTVSYFEYKYRLKPK